MTTSNFISKNLSLDQTALQGNVSQQEAKRDFLKEQGYIQPNKKAQNADSDFNLLGHLEPDPEPKTISLNGGDGIRDETEIPLPPKAKNACLTPRGEKVRQGQFVKAYRFQNGFTDLTCQAQIRLCADGELEGTYQYPSCKVRETSYQDFVHGYLDAQEPSPQRLLKMLEKNYEAEDAVLTPEVAREMKQMLEQEEK